MIQHHNDEQRNIIQRSTMIEYLLVPPLLIFLYLLYHLVIKIYLVAWQFKQMDPSLKFYIAPFSGMLGLQQDNIRKFADSQRFMKDMIKQNPDQRAYFTNLGSKPFLILCDPQLVREFSLNPRKYRKFNLYKHSRLSYEKGIFFSEDETWSNIRSIIRHSFGHEQLKNMIPSMKRSILDYNKTLKAKVNEADSKSVDFKVVHDTELLIGEILVRIFFSQEGIKKKVGNTPLSIALAEFTVNVFDRSRSGPNILFSLFFGEKVKDMNFCQKDRDMQAQLTQIREKIDQILQPRLALKEDPEKDFIQHYIEEKRKTDKMIEEAEAKGQPHKIRRITTEEIIQQLISFYFAGIDTTGHLVAFALFALAEYPQHRQRIIDQIKTHIQDLDSITYENLQKLQFVGYFLDECLRMWPPATGVLARVTREETKIGPYTLPADMLIGTNIIGLMHNPKFYDKPEVFNPDRWATKGAHTTEAYSFIPFSAGTKSCIGKYLALMETKLIMIYLLNEFEFERTEVPLRLRARFLYEPIEEDLIRLRVGGMGLK